MRNQISIEVWPIGRLIPYIRNPRKNDHAVERMAASIQEFGFKVPMLVRGNGEVVDGHLRLKAAQKLGMTEIPAIICDDWTEAQVKAFRLMVNRSVTWADFDLELVSLEMEELKTLDFDLGLTGFDLPEIDGFLFGDQDNDESGEIVSELQDAEVTKPGDLWICGPHRVLCGDATSQEAVGLLFGSAQPALMITDPPYGVRYDPNWPDGNGS
jgi:ParB/Sulfiredoxin domain